MPERWSRTIGALGGQTAWDRIRGLRVAVVGLGRTGSLAAVSLARLGVQSLVLIDPDVVELSNTDAAELLPHQVGMLKVEAVAALLRTVHPEPALRLHLLPRSVVSTEALDAVAASHVVVCCVDSDAARLVVGAAAAQLRRPLLDVGTGIHLEGGTRRAGADVRLIANAGSGCLLCIGSVVAPARALVTLAQEFAGLPTPPMDWRQQRAGSLRTLNAVAVHLGLGMLQDYLVGALRESRWMRYELSPEGLPGLEQVAAAGAMGCAVCAGPTEGFSSKHRAGGGD